MIPIKLTLRNFMCYRDATESLDLRGVHLACLSGENGAGKSALLEAITWSLWGRARGQYYAGDELISKGANEMEVDFTFMLGGHYYRVIRKRARKSNNGTTLLDLQVCDGSDPDNDTWRGLSGGSVTETQEKINSVLKIDYNTFVNSAFILQGRADSFTVKNAAERKQVLGDILGLDQYDRLEERAKAEAKERRSRMTDLEGRIAQIDRELSLRPAHAQELKAVEAELFEAQGNLATLRSELSEVQSRKQSLEHSRSRLVELEARARRLDSDLVNAQARIINGTAREEELKGIISRREEIERGYRELQAVQEEERRLNEGLLALSRLNREQAICERQIETERAELVTEQRQRDRQIAELERRLAGRTVAQQNLSEVLATLSRLERLQEQHEDTRCARDAFLVKVRTLTGERDACEKEGKQLRQKLDLLVHAHAGGNGHANCPLCGTDLSSDALERVRRSYEHDITEKRKEYDQKRKELEAANQEILTTDRRLQSEQEQLKPLPDYRRREAQYRQALDSLDRDEVTLGNERAALEQVKAKLTGEEYAREARAELKKIAAAIKEVAYDEAAHDGVRQRLANLQRQRYDEAYHALAGAVRELPIVRERLEEDREQQQAYSEELEGCRAEIEALKPEVAQLDEVTRTMTVKQLQVAELASCVGELGERRGALRNKLARCDELQEEKGKLTAEYNTASEEFAIYNELTTAFGKKGIQAMVIENVIPEIEEEANALLGRMTDGRMSVQINTQKDAKTSKSVIETLDINISDEMGTRAYELYSGGEAFRVNFALRIALSKLLARRAGTQLQTLVIDEGFGSQDGQGRERLIAAIRSIQSDFEKILVITHIEELKEEFPIRINIVKTSTGSRIITEGDM